MASLLKDKMKEIESKLIHGTPKENNPAGNS
jgi:hypothetical protein